MEASFIEVYNESLRDLLAEGRTPREAGKVLDNNAIKHMADGRPLKLLRHDLRLTMHVKMAAAGHCLHIDRNGIQQCAWLHFGHE